MIRFEHPEMFLFGLLGRRTGCIGASRHRPPVTVLRILVLGAICALLAEPYREGQAQGRDLVLLVDRSRSVPSDVL